MKKVVDVRSLSLSDLVKIWINRKFAVICSSNRFDKEICNVEEMLSKRGFTVLTVTRAQRSKTEKSGNEFDLDFKNQLILSHFHKIIVAKLVFIINKDGYIGESVSEEIKFAEMFNKQIEYLEDT